MQLAHGLLQVPGPAAVHPAAGHRLRVPRGRRTGRDAGDHPAGDVRPPRVDRPRRVLALRVPRPRVPPAGPGRAERPRCLVRRRARRHRPAAGGGGRVRDSRGRRSSPVLSGRGPEGDGPVRGRAARRRARPDGAPTGDRDQQPCGEPRHPGRHRELHLARDPCRRNARDLRRGESPLPVQSVGQHHHGIHVRIDASGRLPRAEARERRGNAA